MSHVLTFRVLGTKCASCEIVLERELKTIPGVERVVASHLDNRVTITAKDGIEISTQDLEAKVGAHGYRFERWTDTASPKNVMWKHLGATAIIVVALYLLMSRSGLLLFAPTVESGAGLGAVFVIGLVAAFSSCTAVVGGLVMAVSSATAKANTDRTPVEKVTPHLLFNAGRLAGFAGFGALTGLLGSAISLSPTANGFLVIAIALFMIVLGVNLLDILPKNFDVIGPPKWLSHRIHDLSRSKNPAAPLVLGGLTYFLPCGFTQSMQLLALSTGDALQATLIMTVFALGTLPALLGVGLVASLTRGRALTLITRAAGAFVIVLGLSNVQNGATLLGWGGFVRASADTEDVVVIADGKQVIQMEISPDLEYVPALLTVIEDIPVEWEIYGTEHLGCASTLVSNKLGLNASLEPGYNTVLFTPTDPGVYTFTCSMGMTRGTLRVLPTDSST